jgi:signal transduction histidine kinase
VSPDDVAPGAFDDARAAEARAGSAGDRPIPPELAAQLLAAKLESLAEFAAGAGHEINNPLAVISGRAQLLLRGETDPERRRDLAIIHMQAMRVHEMIADMMLFARPPLPKPALCDVAELVGRACETLRSKAATLDLLIECVGTSEPAEANVDGEQITVAVRAIVDNALNAMRPGGRATIGVTADQTAVEITIANDGPGIPDAEREHLFDPFFSGRQAGRGLGMGLAKAWRIVTNHGGTIEVDPQFDAAAKSETRRGATFVVRLPRRLS